MLTPRVHGADKQTTTKKSEQGQRWTYTHSSSQRPVKNVGHKRAGPFLFSLRIARMHRAEPGSPFTGEPGLWKWWPPRRRRKTKPYRGGICVQRYLFPHPPPCLHWSFPHPWRYTRALLSPSTLFFVSLCSTRTTASPFLHVDPLARIQPSSYVLYIRFNREGFQHPDPEIHCPERHSNPRKVKQKFTDRSIHTNGINFQDGVVSNGREKF